MMELLPLQAHAALRTGLLHGRSLAVFAPTSSGKTFGRDGGDASCGAWGADGVPCTNKGAGGGVLRAAAGAIRADGVSGGGVHAGANGDDGAICTGQFDLAVMIYEKLRAHLVAAPALASALACVVVDEVQILGEAERAVAADLVLTKLMHGERPPQLVCTSAAVDDADRLCEWLKCERLVWRERPVELREGVLDLARGVCLPGVEYGRAGRGAAFRAGELAGGFGRGAEAQAWVGRGRRGAIEGSTRRSSGREWCAWCALLEVERGEQVLVFVPTRALSRGVGGALCRGARVARRARAGAGGGGAS